MLAQVWLAPMAEPEWADGILHQSLGEIIAALLASGLLLPVTLFLLVLLVAHLSRDYGKPVRRRISDPPLCSAYRDHPPANCVDDPPVSLAVRLRLPLRIALWVAGIALVLTIVWQANLLITGSWSPTVIFDAGLYESKLRDQCQIAHNWLLDNSFEIDRRGCSPVRGCNRMIAIQQRCSQPNLAGNDDSEAALLQAFATAPECARVRFLPFYRSYGRKVVRHMSPAVYRLDIEPRWRDDDLQSWVLINGGQEVRGAGTISELVPAVCRLARSLNLG